jgi:hypothetical protein
MSDDKTYRDCMAEIVGVLKKYDMAGALTVVSKERAMFKYHFPTWSCIVLGDDSLRFRSKRADYPSAEAQRVATELSAHIIMQMRDIAAQTLAMMTQIAGALEEKLGVEHEPYKDFDPEREH